MWPVTKITPPAGGERSLQVLSALHRQLGVLSVRAFDAKRLGQARRVVGERLHYLPLLAQKALWTTHSSQIASHACARLR